MERASKLDIWFGVSINHLFKRADINQCLRERAVKLHRGTATRSVFIEGRGESRR